MPLPTPDPHPPAPAADLTVERPTIEAALAEVTSRLGPDAEIVEARKVARGGIGGFFAKEMVQLTARAGRVGVASPPEAQAELPVPVAGPEAPGSGGVAAVLDRLAARADAEEARFQDVLRRELGADLLERALGPEPGAPAADAALPGPVEHLTVTLPAPGPRPTPRPAWHPSMGPEAPAPPPLPSLPAAPPVLPEIDGPPGMGRVDWNAAALGRAGVPPHLAQAVEHIDPADDAAWISALAQAIAPMCGRVPKGPAVLAGPGAPRLASVLGLPLAEPGDNGPAPATFAAQVSTPEEAAWLRAAKGDRALHLVTGGGDWQPAWVETPVAVSWVSDGGLPAALHVAATSGCPLGFASTGGFPVDIVVAGPVEAALALRRLVGRR